MFDRFTDTARKVMALSRREAQGLNHDYIGTEHILLGLAGLLGLPEKPGVAAKVLDNLGVSPDLIRTEVQKDLPVGTVQVSRVGQMPFTPGAKQLLERSMKQAEALGHRYLGTEHLLLAMLEGEQDPAGRTLRKLNLRLDDVRKEVLSFLNKEKNLPALRVIPIGDGEFEVIDKGGKARAWVAMAENDRLSIELFDKGKRLRFAVVFGPDGSLELKDKGGKTQFKAP